MWMVHVDGVDGACGWCMWMVRVDGACGWYVCMYIPLLIISCRQSAELSLRLTSDKYFNSKLYIHTQIK